MKLQQNPQTSNLRIVGNNNNPKISSFTQTSSKGSGDGPGSGDGGGGYVDLEIINAKLAAAKSETREMVADLRTELVKIESNIEISNNNILSKLTTLPSKFNLWAAAGTTIAVVVAIITLAGDRFDGGYAASSAYALQLEKYRTQTAEQLSDTNKKVDQAIKQVDTRFDQFEKLLVKATTNSGNQTNKRR